MYQLKKKSSRRSIPGLSLRLVSNFLKHFGHLVKSLEIIYDFDDDIINIIADYCGKTLINMDIVGQENTTDNFNAISEFKALQTIFISSISMDNVELSENLELIMLKDIKVQEDLHCIGKKFPKLEVASFENIFNLRDTAINKLITFNPQIEKLSITNCENVTTSTLNSISDRLSNLMHLNFECIENTTIDQYNKMVMNLSQLRQLWYLDIIFDSNCEYPANILFESLAANTQTIEELLIGGLQYDFEKTVNVLLEMKQLKMLYFFLLDDNYMSANMIIELIKELPNLKKIWVNFDTISVSEIIEILQYSEILKKLTIDIQEMNINLFDYNSILASIKGNLKVKLLIWAGNIDENIFEKKMSSD